MLIKKSKGGEGGKEKTKRGKKGGGGGGHKIRVYNTGASDKQANWQQIKTDTPDKGTQNTRAANSSLQQGHGHLDSPQHDSKDTDGLNTTAKTQRSTRQADTIG